MFDKSIDLPEWILPPGAIVAQILQSKCIDLDSFAGKLELSARGAREILEGSTKIDDDLAERLASIVGSTSSFWMQCEENYRQDVKRNLSSYIDEDAKNWIKQLPIRDMSKLGWIKQYRDVAKQVEECFKFFGIFGLEDWHQKRSALLAGANFRTTEAFMSNSVATSAWIRWAENRADDVKCEIWNKEVFADRLDKIRALSRNHHPERFVPVLRKLCAEAGVALIIAPAPEGCRASGATRFLRPKKAMIVLSFRYYSDDQFWFTFFHEAGHLLHHTDRAFFLEEDFVSLDEKEREANSFAFNKLIPPDAQREMLELQPEHNAYIAFAKDIGVSPGIVVGQMQRLGHLPYAWLNKLKRSFKWKALYETGIIP